MFHDCIKRCVKIKIDYIAWHVKKCIIRTLVIWGYSSVVEHSTADREVPGSNPGAPFSPFFFLIFHFIQFLKILITILV